MLTKTHITTILVVFTAVALEAQDCPCRQKFDFFKEKIQVNYSGYRDKVTTKNQSDYEAHTARFQEMADQANSDTACFRVLDTWKKWFHDGHVQLFYADPTEENPEKIRAKFALTEKISLTEIQARTYVDQGNRLPIEGIWRNGEGNYRVAITAQPNAKRDFAAVILKADSIYWMPGQVKFELQNIPNTALFSVRYYMRDHSSMPQDTAKLTDGILSIPKIGNWYRVYPAAADVPPPPALFSLTPLDSTTALLVIPTMNEGERSQLDQLMKKNKDYLARTPNLVIDCRGNGGGSDITYRLVAPLLYTNRIKTFRMQTWATKDNADKYANLQKDKNYPWYIRAYGGMTKRQIHRHLGKMIGKKTIATSGRRKIKAFPKRVAVLIDGNCASSCESFVEMAKQSSKVTLIGVNTAGVSDYGNLHTIPFPCGGLSMAYPTTRSAAVERGEGIDGIGYPPDIRLDATTKDWVAFAKDYLHKK